MATALPHSEKISRDSIKSAEFRTIVATMGDSYTQIAPKGLNSKIDNWNIRWIGLTLVEKDAVLTALDTVGEWGLLSWTPSYETVLKYFRIKKGTGYSVKHVAGNNDFTVTCKLIEQFDVNP